MVFHPKKDFGLGSNRIVLWCNGSTTVFGSVCPGSNPGKTTSRSLDQLLVARQGILSFLYAMSYDG